MGRFDALTKLEKEPAKMPLAREVVSPVGSKQETTILPENNQFTSLLANQQASKEVNQQASKLVKKQASKEVNQQTTKEKKKYGTYLREESILAIQIQAVQTKRKDHEVLQEAVDRYFESLKK